jgi:hypothetical protein
MPQVIISNVMKKSVGRTDFQVGFSISNYTNIFNSNKE